MKIGVLALQGDFAEHIAALHRLGVDAPPVRLPAHLEGIGRAITAKARLPVGGKAVRVGFKTLEDNRKVRVAKRSGEMID